MVKYFRSEIRNTEIYKHWDFTLDKYRELCHSAISAGYKVLTCRDYLQITPKPEKVVILRHDIDDQPARALRMAKIESETGVQSTYYFKLDKKVFQPRLIKEIASLGHEIGYHYEVLDRALGDRKKAVRLFEKELAEFRKVYDVKTLSSHGNSMTKWDNRDTWKEYDFREFGIVGEAYLSLSNIAYFSETGRTWNNKFKIKDRMPGNGTNRSEDTPEINTTSDLIRLIKKGDTRHLSILAHPNNWSANPVEWYRVLIANAAMNLGKRIILRRKRLK